MNSKDKFPKVKNACDGCCNANQTSLDNLIASSCSPPCNRRNQDRTRSTPVRSSVPDLGHVAMPYDVTSTVHMIGQCLRCRNKMILQYMYKSARKKRCIFQTTLMIMGNTGVGKSSVVNHLFNTDLVPTSAVQSETRSVTEYTAITAIEELRTTNVRLRAIDTPGFNDTDGLRQDACNLMAIKKYCEKNCCLRRSCFTNVILLCVKADDNRILGPQCNLAKSLKILKDLQVIDPDCPNLMIVMTHACSIGCNINNADKWKRKLRDKAVAFQSVLKEHIGFEPFVSYIENGIDDNDLTRVNGGSVLPDGTIQPLNLFDVIIKMLHDNKDELGYATIREFYKRSSEGVNFHVEIDRSVQATIAESSSLSEEEEACAKALLQIGDEWELIRKSVDLLNNEEKEAIRQAVTGMEKQIEDYGLLVSGESLRLNSESGRIRSMTSFSSFSESGLAEKSPPIDKRREDAESKVLPPEDRDVAFQTIIVFMLSIVGIVCLASVGILGTIFLGPAGFAVGASAGTACAFLCTVAKGCSTKYSKPDNDPENGTFEDLKK